jgi:DNA-binding transcriptional regulator YbjK
MVLGLLGAIGLVSTVAVAQTQPDAKPDPLTTFVPALQALQGQRSVYQQDVFQELQPFGMQSGSNQAAKLAKQYVKSEKEDEKKEIRKKLADLLAQQFDQHMEQQQKELKELEKQIESLKTLLKKRGEAKPAIVDRRLEQLLQDASGLGWTAPSNIGVDPTARIKLFSDKK